MSSFLKTLHHHQKCGRALLAANFYNFETLVGILQAAKAEDSEVILQTSPSTVEYLGVQTAAAMARAASQEISVTTWLHLDHATDEDLIHQCMDAGYDSVMIDASASTLDENTRRTSHIVKAAHARNIVVEAELGYIAKLGQPESVQGGLTDPDEAVRFAQQTKVDMLAVAIGTAHGFYKKNPCLDIDRLKEIHQKIPLPLVLHGGSGLTPEQWQESIQHGIVKINFATEIKDTFTRRLKECLVGSSEIDLRKTFPPATEAVKELVMKKIRVCSMSLPK